ncbi:Major facilitator superfamily domain general substrate transporter [Penicillium capsulatum]|nr:Major facilitator superfamily domain general substrate transporter [Penicillium capsulatum]
MLFAGRLVQAVANTGVGVLGLANLTQKTSPDELGKLYGIITISTAIGTSGGPLIAGALFKWVGYWTAWSCAFVASFVAIILQGLMVEPTHPDDVADGPVKPDAECDEESPLLPDPEMQSLFAEKNGVQFYTCLFSNRRYIGGIISTLCYSIVIASFDTTLPLHIRETFHWGSLPAGLLFAALQGPNAFLSVPVAWLKQRMGTRHPTSVGFAALAVFLWLTGVPGDSRFPWANCDNRGPILYIIAVTGSGVMISLLNGVGMTEANRKYLRSIGYQ